MSEDLVLKSLCERCGVNSNLYGSNCKHMTICLPCGKHLAETKAVCSTCRSPVTSLIREYNVRACDTNNKRFSIGTFKDGLPEFFKKGSAEKLFVHKEGLKGPRLTDAVRDKYKNKPWIIEDESGKNKYQGKLEGSQQGTYYILMIRERDIVAIPIDEWYSFSKVLKYKQLSSEEAEEKMKNRKRAAEGFSRWMMKIANSGAAKGGKLEQLEGSAWSGRKKGDDEANDIVLSDREEENEDEEEERKGRLGLNKRVGDDNEEEVKVGGFDADDDDDIGKGDDWEHEEIFTDDDEAIGSEAEDEDESDSEDSVLPEIKQDEDESSEEEGEGLSVSGKELKKLLETKSKIDDDNEDGDENEETHIFPLLAQQKDIPKVKALKIISTKAQAPVSTSSMPVTTKSVGAKRKSDNEDAKPTEASPTKRQKTDDLQSTKTTSVRDEVIPISKSVSTSGKHTLRACNKATGAQTAGPVPEEELLEFLREMAPVTTQIISAKFKPRIKTQEDKLAFAQVLKKISRLEKINGVNYLVLRNI
ncbi:hypothetical protein SUGI_0460710 [Cryptomeria japonica]|uniref:transcription initiation factor IIF subunit alpha n=1 Tax=Cryptomeria japonica TaxID=3369 RepID=UPI002408938C|nr:transcription initiation factor IIF subunit alpha [Cryptomeria japonica]GLJ24150.1 hypothetical protein SUGI_0460710 [Cryptomeria japonica]